MGSAQEGKPRHPQRWTGVGRDLLTDAREADKLQTEFAFERFYQTRYRELCWATHGSGMVGVRALNSAGIIFMGARAYRECRCMAMLSARLVLDHFALFDDRMKSEFETTEVAARLVERKAMADKGFATPFDNEPREDPIEGPVEATPGPVLGGDAAPVL